MALMIWKNVVAFVASIPSCNYSVVDGDRGVCAGIASSMSNFPELHECTCVEKGRSLIWWV